MERLNLKWVVLSSVCALLVIPLLLFYVEYSFNSFRFYTNHTPLISVYNLPVIISLVCFAVLAPIFARVKPKLLILPVALVVISQTVCWFLTRRPERFFHGFSFVTDFYAIGYIVLFITLVLSIIDAKSELPLLVIPIFFLIVSVIQKTVEMITILAMGTHTVLVQPMTEGYPTVVQMYDDISLDEMLKMILFSLSMLFLALSVRKPGKSRADLMV